MKKYLAFFLLLSVTALVYGRPQKLVIKTDKESVELRYWPLDGKQLRRNKKVQHIEQDALHIEK